MWFRSPPWSRVTTARRQVSSGPQMTLTSVGRQTHIAALPKRRRTMTMSWERREQHEQSHCSRGGSTHVAEVHAEDGSERLSVVDGADRLPHASAWP